MKGEGLRISCMCNPQPPAVHCSLGNNTSSKNGQSTSTLVDSRTHTHTLNVYTDIKMCFAHSADTRFTYHFCCDLVIFVLHDVHFFNTARCFLNENKSLNTAPCWQKKRIVITEIKAKLHTGYSFKIDQLKLVH